MPERAPRARPRSTDCASHGAGASASALRASAPPDTTAERKSGRAGVERDPEYEAEVRAAESEAADIGGVAGDEGLDPAERPVREAGGGEAEGFEEAQELLIDHASHGDQQSAHAILHDELDEDDPDAADQEEAEADFERSSERDEENT